MVVQMDFPDAEVDPRFPRPVSRAEWTRMVEAGELDREPVELIRGAVVRMSPPGEPSVRLHDYLVRALNLQLDDAYRVSGQGALAAVEDSEPQPDIMVTVADRPRRDHPTEALLIVEISVSSLRYDLGTKLELYAESGIPEYWVIDVKRATVHVHTQPDRAARRYGSVAVLRDGDVLRPTLLAQVAIAVADLPR